MEASEARTMDRSNRATSQSGVLEAAGETTEVPVTLSAFGAPATSGVATILHRSLASRASRAGAALGVAWLLAFPAIFLPVAHFVLVPGLIIGGVVLGAIRLAEARTLARVRGVCPRCQAALDLSPGGRYRLPRMVQCDRCRNELTLAAPAAA
jgi:hypothetical protein